MTDTQKLAQEIDEGRALIRAVLAGHPVDGDAYRRLDNTLQQARDSLPVWVSVEDVKYKKGEVYVTRFKPVIREYRPELSLQTAYEVSVGKKAIMGRREPDMVLCLPQPPEPD